MRMEINRKSLLKEMGQRYYDRRKSLGFTQEEAAEIADVTQQAISDAELGKSFLSPDSMLKLCKAYDVSCDYIMTGNVSDVEAMLIDKRIRDLSPDAFFHYERMTDHFLSAIKASSGSLPEDESNQN
jgi:transcriptional regulator with XRE-family HTH domain